MIEGLFRPPDELRWLERRGREIGDRAVAGPQHGLRATLAADVGSVVERGPQPLHQTQRTRRVGIGGKNREPGFIQVADDVRTPTVCPP